MYLFGSYADDDLDSGRSTWYFLVSTDLFLKKVEKKIIMR